MLGAVWTPKPSDFTEPLEKVREPKVFFLGRECDPGKMQMQGVVVYDLFVYIYIYISYIYIYICFFNAYMLFIHKHPEI